MSFFESCLENTIKNRDKKSFLKIKKPVVTSQRRILQENRIASKLFRIPDTILIRRENLKFSKNIIL